MTKSRITVRKLDKDLIASLAVRSATFARWDHGEVITVTSPSRRTFADMLSMPPPHIPEFVSLAFAPFVAPDGEIVIVKGLHRKTGLYLVLDADLEGLKLPDRPSAYEVAAAKTVIEDCLWDFPFEEQSDRDNAIAAMITPFVRPMFDDITPLLAITAPSRGQGKSLLAEILLLPFLGTVPQFTTWPRNDAELRKKLLAVMMEGQPCCVFDNAEGTVYSGDFCSVLTSPSYQDRFLGETRMIQVQQRVNWMITGNNLEFGGDLSRRIVPIRINTDQADTSSREFRYPDLPRHVMANRRLIVESVLILIRNWICTGARPGSRTLPSFGRWASALGGILEAAGYDSFLADRSGIVAEHEPWRAEEEVFIQCWWETYATRPVTAADLKAVAEESAANPIGADFREATYVRSLGKWLSKKRDNFFGSFVVRRGTSLSRGGAVQYYLERTVHGG